MNSPLSLTLVQQLTGNGGNQAEPSISKRFRGAKESISPQVAELTSLPVFATFI